jgi:hypothetical protein
MYGVKLEFVEAAKQDDRLKYGIIRASRQHGSSFGVIAFSWHFTEDLKRIQPPDEN